MRKVVAVLPALLSLAVVAFITPAVAGQAVNLPYVTPQPLASVIQTPVAACGTPTTWLTPTIAWGADIATSLANGNAKRTAPGSIFAQKRLDVSLYRQDNFPQQVADYVACKTPLLRGTLGMLAQAAEVFADPRTAPVIIYHLSWSNGGDYLIAKETIRAPADLRGKTIVVQAYGPHIDYLLKILADAGLTPRDVTIRYTKDFLDTGPNSFSPARAFATDPNVDAVFVITPEALTLTSNGKVGTGTEGSVRGAHVLMSTKTAVHVIADVYAVRKDFFDAHPQQLLAFTSGLLLAEEQLRNIMKMPGAEQRRVLSAAGGLLLDSTTDIESVTGMYADAEMAGFPENVKFFTDQAYPRGFARLTDEIGQSFVSLGLLTKPISFTHAGWDYASLAPGLTNTQNVVVPRFDTKAVDQFVQTRARQADNSEGALFAFEVRFGARQNTFPAEQYQGDFARAVNLASTYGGAILTIEGHSDPTAYLQCKRASADPAYRQELTTRLSRQTPPSSIEQQCLAAVPGPRELSRLQQASRNLSYSRANGVKDSLTADAMRKGITLDPSQFGVVGYGFSQPNTPRCIRGADNDIALSCMPATEQEWNATRRVVFRIIQVEAEASIFTPF